MRQFFFYLFFELEFHFWGVSNYITRGHNNNNAKMCGLTKQSITGGDDSTYKSRAQLRQFCNYRVYRMNVVLSSSVIVSIHV